MFNIEYCLTDTYETNDLATEWTDAHANAVPWDMRGPCGPSDGGPSTWRGGQKWREGSQRFANSGGKKSHMYAHYNQMRASLTGYKLWFHHPKNMDGYWGAELAELENASGSASSASSNAWQGGPAPG